MGWHFLRVVDERTNVASSYENQLVCSLETAGKLFQPQTKTSCLHFRIKADNQNNLSRLSEVHDQKIIKNCDLIAS